MAAPEVLMYASSWCGYCERARQLLQRKGIAFREVDVDSAGRTEMIARTGRRTVPQIFIGGVHVGGSDELQALEAEGKLDQLLAPVSIPRTNQ